MVRREPIKVRWINDIDVPFILPVDPTLHWANPNKMAMPGRLLRHSHLATLKHRVRYRLQYICMVAKLHQSTMAIRMPGLQRMGSRVWHL